MGTTERWRQRPVAVGLATGSVVLGVIGCIAGLVRGLTTYVPTAWAATFELGIPSFMAGAVVGTMVGLIVLGSRRLHR